MAKQQIDIGVEGNDGTGDSIRESFRKVNENFTELYAVFGIGGQISLTDLTDTPDTYEGNENKVPVVRSNGSGIDFLELASNNALDGGADTIGFDFSVDGKLIIRQLVSRVANDPEPVLSGPLNAATQAIANVSVSQAAIDTFNSIYGTDLGIDSLVINKGYADRNYQVKEVAGGGVRLNDEPASRSQYILTLDDFGGNPTFSSGYAVITDHGLDAQFTGAPFIFNCSGTDPLNLTSGTTYYIRVQDADRIALYTTEENAINNTARILAASGSGTATLTDAAYDEDLEGNWLSNVALPRKSVVRRQGDSMTGALNLHDHPGELAGFGLPNGPDDLQAATKLYVDNAAASSNVNIYVSTSGDDAQTYTPEGREGRNPAYAYRTINAAARKAEEIIESSDFEPGPYMQTMTFNTGQGNGTIVTAGINSPISGRTNARTLIIENKEFIEKEVTAYIDQLYPDFSYNREICQRDIGYILESVTLDSLLGDNANYLSRWSGIRYYSSPSARRAIGSQYGPTVTGIQYAKSLVVNYILTNTAVPTTYQDRVEQYIEPLIVPDANADSAIAAKFDIVIDVINDGVLQAPAIVDGSTTYKINIGNGNFGFIDQANPENTDIIPGKVVRGKTSGALARIIDYKYEAGTRPVSVVETDEIEVQLLKPIEFVEGEELEYGNVVRETQVAILVESGIYYEDYPIRVPVNVSLKGDEFRRSIIRPKQRVSQSRWASTYFYRDKEFDGLVLGRSDISAVTTDTSADASRTAGTYTIDSSDYETNNYGTGAEFEIVVDANGAVSSITVTNPGENWQVGDIITVSDSSLGNGGADDVLITVSEVPNGIPYYNPLNGNIDGYFGYHYLKNPGQLKNTGPGYTNIGGWETAALTLIDNKEFIQEQVVEYINTTYPAMIGNYSEAKSQRDTGIIVDALVQDLRNGGNEFALQTQGGFYEGSLGNINQEGCVAGMNYIYTIASKLILGEAPTTIYGTGLTYPTPDLFNGAADPADWAADELYRVGSVVRFLSGGNYTYYRATVEHTSGSIFNAGEIAAYWNLIPGPDETIENLIGTITFAFNEDYNPPLRNDEMDVFLMNDSTRVQNLTVQGHGGFMVVLDPEGQVLTKSPYIQVGSSFSKSQNKQVFSGGMFIDAFTGNSAMQVVERVDGSPFRLRVQSLGSQAEPQGLFVRKPQTPAAFYIDGRRFQVNAITQYDPDFGTAELILSPDSNDGAGFTGTTSQLITGIDLDSIGEFEFDEAKCERDSLIILRGVGYDTVLGTNYNSVTNGLAYRRNTASVVIDDQLAETLAALAVGKSETIALSSVAADGTALSRATAAWDEVIDIVGNGTGAADALTWSDPGVVTERRYARELLQLNRSFIAGEVTDYITATYPSLTYDVATCQRDIRYIVDALSYDVQYGGNSGTVVAAGAYFDGAVSVLPTTAQKEATADAMAQLATIISDIVTESYAGQTLNGGNVATGTEVTTLTNLVGIIETVIDSDNIAALPSVTYPDVTWAAPALQNARNQISGQSALIAHRIVQSVDAPLAITLQTAGNRSMLGNDFTQINDLGYGLVCVNGALSEMVSMFTYYCWTSYYAKNGSQIRSVTGSSCYGEYGLVAEGSDPNEIPDRVTLDQDMVQSARTFSAEVVLYLPSRVILEEGEEIDQLATGATGTVAVGTGDYGSFVVYLNNVSGSFDTTNAIRIVGPITGDSTITPLGVIPDDVDILGYDNPAESLSLYVYDMIDPPSNRSEFDIYHPTRPAFARYEVANAEQILITLGKYENINDTIPTTELTTAGSGAIFNVLKTAYDGYSVEIVDGGIDYAPGETFEVDGIYLNGETITHNALITVDEIDSSGTVTAASITGTHYVDPMTPSQNGTIYKLNFSTSDAQFSQNGLLNEVGWGDYINYRRNQTHILGDIARPDVLSIRPSTAVIFDENPGFVYRSISFLTSDSIGNDLDDNQAQAGFDETYDYIRLIIDSSKAQEAPLAGTGTTKGGTVGDVVLACLPTLDENEVYRLNNNARTPEANRPIGWTDSTLVEAPIFTWNGKKHYVYNARGVDATNTVVDIAEDNEYVIVDIADVGEEIVYPATGTGLAATTVLGSELVTIRAGLKTGAEGDVTINISTCRATAHDFLEVGTGGFNQSNYPNVIFGLPREKDQAKEVEERTKGRVFYVSTDQDGIFRVGRFFSVDQGTGTVTFSASIALSDVDGLGFKRGVVVTEFSTDTAMTDNASDTVPTELAVRGYVNRRLGYDVNGAPVSNKLGPGVLAPNGAVPMTDDLNAAGNTITNLKNPDSASDAATKGYVDSSRGDTDTIPDLRDIEINDVEEGQFLVSTGYKKIYIDASTVVSGPYEPGDVFTGSISGATGTVVDVYSTTGFEGALVAIIYTPGSGTISTDADGLGQDIISVVGGAEGRAIDGPMDEWANGVWNAASDIIIDTNRELTIAGGVVTDRYTTLNMQYKPNSIVNSDVNSNAEIAQSKLDLNAGTTRANATGITQADLGVAAFDSSNFDATDGWISIKNNGIALGDIAQIATKTVLGNSTGATADVTAVAFSTVVTDGGGLVDGDFTTTVSALSDPGEALIKTGTGTYALSNVSVTGEVNSIVKTDANGSIQVNSLILGGDPSYEVLALDTTELVFKTPAQGEILRSVGNSGTSGNANPDVEIPGHLNIGGTGVAESTLQNVSNFNGESALGVDWIYSSFIEAPGEKGAASTGIAIGANTGKTTIGQIGMVVADSVTSSSLTPFIFSSTGVVPDDDDVYNIGSASFKYNTVYATLFNGTALEAYYADLAENYEADTAYEPGTVLVFGGDKELTTTDQKGDRRVAGVVSTEPATLMNSHLQGDNVVPLALQGRVPCKVLGKVRKGDILVTSAIPGYAVVDNDPKVGTVIGKALENKDDAGKGVIEVVVGKH